MLTPLDHVVVGLSTIFFPLYDLLVWYPRLVKAPHRLAGQVRMRSYRDGILLEWGLAAAALAVWQLQDRPWSELGLGFTLSWGFGLALAIALGFMVFATWQRVELDQDSDEARDEVRAHLNHLRPMLPHSRRELHRFSLLSLTAGICEEVLYRGFLIWYLGLMVPGVAAVLLACALFGMAHAYQGTRGILQTALVGLAMAVLYLMSGSLWVPIVLHAFIDFNSGLVAYRLLGTDQTTD